MSAERVDISVDSLAVADKLLVKHATRPNVLSSLTYFLTQEPENEN